MSTAGNNPSAATQQFVDTPIVKQVAITGQLAQATQCHEWITPVTS